MKYTPRRWLGKIKQKLNHNSISGLKLFVNGLQISTNDYEKFGYFVGGTHYPCERTKKEFFDDNDLIEAIKICSNVLILTIKQLYKQPDYFDCKDFLKNIELKKQIDRISVGRTLVILEENYQNLYKSTKEFTEYN